MRVLCWLNISASKNISCDSGLLQTIGMVRGILEVRKGYHFYLALPDFISLNQLNQLKKDYPILTSPNVTIKYFPMTKIRRITPYEFNFRKMEKALDRWHIDIDFVWNGLPEFTVNLSQLLCRNTNLGWGHFEPIIVNRWHWVMSSDYVAIPDDRVEVRQCEGAIFSAVNTTLCDFTSRMIEDMMKRWYPTKPIDLVTCYNGIELDKIKARKGKGCKHKKEAKYRLLFPNRLQTFKNPKFLLESLIKLRQKRQDFELVLTDPTADFTTNNTLKNGALIRLIQENADWIKVIPVTGNDYYDMIYSSDVVINTSDYETWCVVITEALACGKNVVVPSGLTFEEMISPDYPFIYKKRNKQSFLEKLEAAMTKENTEQNQKYAEKYSWNNVIGAYLGVFEDLRDEIFEARDYLSKDRQRLLEEVRQRKYMKKSEIRKFLGPGEEKCWSYYRRHLLKNGVKDMYESSEPIYYVGEKPDVDKDKQMELF